MESPDMRKGAGMAGSTRHDAMDTGRVSRTIAGLLHDYMVETGATEVEVAELLAVDQTQVGRWRRGQTVPRPRNMAALAELLDVDVDELEAVRVDSERVRGEVAARKRVDPAEELRVVRAELRRATARIKRLERKLDGRG